MTARIFRAIIAVASIVLLASFSIVFLFMYDYLDGYQHAHMKDQLDLAAAAVEWQGSAYLSALSPERYRLTWVNADGSVLYDTHADAAAMENHADRAEIREAWATGAGGSSRHSETLTQETLYEAVALSDGTVLRISISRATHVALLLDTLPIALLVALGALLLSMLMAARMSRRIVEPINNLNLAQPLASDTYKEVEPLLGRIQQQNVQIAEHVRQIRQRADEFEQITGSMQEGLVLLSKKGRILSVNPAAMAIFSKDAGCIGKDFSTLDPEAGILSALEDALRTGHSELRRERNAREYRFAFSRIESDGTAIGVLLLVLDVSEQARAERARREFSANVSHELKSPLQSIMGSAELMQKGMVQPEDVPRFLERIYREAVRLLALIEDIIRLSQLDEGGEMPREDVELSAMAAEIARSMEAAAAERGVSLRVTGSGQVHGVRRLLFEILYNLMDNAIKYNRSAGAVDVSITEDEAETVLCVKDTGIGIPREHQDRVFERFYRVDKSHSRRSGGTGLGLSIVKHAVKYHGARLTLISEPGKGTAISIAFAKAQ